jgi:hypothetical protein
VTRSFAAAGGGTLPRLSRALCAGWAVLVLELSVALLSAARQLASVWELQWGLVWLAPTAMTAAGAVALLGAGLAWLVEHAEARPVRALLAGSTAVAGAIVGFGVGGGRHLATLANRGGFALLVAALGAALVWTTVPAFSALLRRRPGWCFALVVSGGVAAELINRFVLVRLYPAFHLALAVLVLISAPLAAEALERVIGAAHSSRSKRIP